MIIHKLEEAPEYDLIYADPPWQQYRGGEKASDVAKLSLTLALSQKSFWEETKKGED